MKHQKTADEAAYKQNACQNCGQSQTAWEDVSSGARRTPKKGQKARVPEAAREGLNRSLVFGSHAKHQKTADEAAYKQKACQKQGKGQTGWEGMSSGARRTPKRVRKQALQRPQERA